MMTAHNFAIEFYNEVQHIGHAVEKQLQAEAEGRLQRVAAGCRSLRAATVAIEQPLQRDFSHLYMALIVVVDARQKKSAIAARSISAEAALQQALTLLERQLALRYPPSKPFLLRAWAVLCHGQIWQRWEHLASRWRHSRVA